MWKLNPIFVLICILVFIIPFGYYVIKFTQIPFDSGKKISYSPKQCFICLECECEYVIDDQDVYILDKYNKILCKPNNDRIIDSIGKKLSYAEFYLEGSEYTEFYECIKWYSRHPAALGSN